MSSKETINGVPVAEEMIDEWAAEAEAGFDVDALRKLLRSMPVL